MTEAAKEVVVTTRYPRPYNPYPRGYNARVHGPYDPARYYGNFPRPSMWDVKLGNLGWHLFSPDNNFTREHLANTATRFLSRIHARHWRVRKRGFAPFMQLIACGMIIGSFCQWGRFSVDTNAGRICEVKFKYY